MIDLKRMEKRIECCDLVKKHALSWNVTRECNEEMLLGNLEYLIQRGNCAEFGAGSIWSRPSGPGNSASTDIEVCSGFFGCRHQGIQDRTSYERNSSGGIEGRLSGR